MFTGVNDFLEAVGKPALFKVELVGGIALKFAIGRRHFERRFKKATNNKPVEYIPIEYRNKYNKEAAVA